LESGDIIYCNFEYLHQFWTKFEDEFDFGGSSGDSGGIFSHIEVVSFAIRNILAGSKWATKHSDP
jgi:hypothetical protein